MIVPQLYGSPLTVTHGYYYYRCEYYNHTLQWLIFRIPTLYVPDVSINKYVWVHFQLCLYPIIDNNNNIIRQWFQTNLILRIIIIRKIAFNFENIYVYDALTTRTKYSMSKRIQHVRTTELNVKNVLPLEATHFESQCSFLWSFMDITIISLYSTKVMPVVSKVNAM